MRYLLVSDVHANIEALESVLKQAERIGYDRVVCMGDLVGYGASPNEVVERIRLLSPVIIRGNHDKVIAGLDSGEQFNPLAEQSCSWTQQTLERENIAYLGSLPRGPLHVDRDFWIAHGTPLDEDAYILTDLDALEVFQKFPHELCFFGHSHIPSVFSLDEVDGLYVLSPLDDDERIACRKGSRYLINCGSVGQPRDRNVKAAYGIFDSETRLLGLHRVSYEVGQAQQRILNSGLPRFLAERLAYGV